MKFNKRQVSELITEIAMGPFGSNIKVDCFVDAGIPVLNGSNLEGITLKEEQFRFVTKEKSDSLKKANASRGDIVITHRGTLGQIVYIPQNSKYEKYVISQSQFRLRCNNEIFPEYFVYYFHTPIGQHKILSNASQVGVPALARPSTTFQKLEIEVPDKITQKKIVSFLNSLEDKIALNNSINKNLYQQIETLCKSWLTNYEPFGGECPADWEITHLGDIAEFISGYSYKGQELTEKSNIAMATIKNFERSGGFKLTGYKPIIPSNKLKSEQHVELFDTLVAHTDLTQNADVIGNAELVLSKSDFDDIVFSMDLVKVLPKKNKVSSFLLAALLHSNNFKQHCLGYVNGTTVLHLSKKALPDYELPLPKNLNLLKPLDDALAVIYQQLSSKIEENTVLTKLRDTLLPKLIAGEIDVSEIEI